MSDKTLIDKAIDIKGKKYVLVSDRVLYFNETYPEGSITTELVSKPEDETVVIKATIRPDMANARTFTGYSQATWNDGYINKTSALENAETSAVGRALAFMGIGVIESIASIDEIKKTTVTAPRKSLTPDEAFTNAQKALEEALTIAEKNTVMRNVMASKILTVDMKNELGELHRSLTEGSDPLND